MFNLVPLAVNIKFVSIRLSSSAILFFRAPAYSSDTITGGLFLDTLCLNALTVAMWNLLANSGHGNTLVCLTKNFGEKSGNFFALPDLAVT